MTWLVTMFKKFKLDTQETLGFGPVDLPELEMPTNACWWALDETLSGGLSMDDLQGGMLGKGLVFRNKTHGKECAVHPDGGALTALGVLQLQTGQLDQQLAQLAQQGVISQQQLDLLQGQNQQALDTPSLSLDAAG